MEQVLTNQSRIPARVSWLKPLSAAIAIGTGGPFGAEGPIIATGGALGSLVGQMLETVGSRAKDATGRRRGGRHGGDVRQPGFGGAAGGANCCFSNCGPARWCRSPWPAPSPRQPRVGLAQVARPRLCNCPDRCRPRAGFSRLMCCWVASSAWSPFW